jgi:hypothetical protein
MAAFVYCGERIMTETMEPFDGLELIDLGNTSEETKQGWPNPIYPDNMHQLGSFPN